MYALKGTEFKADIYSHVKASILFGLSSRFPRGYCRHTTLRIQAKPACETADEIETAGELTFSSLSSPLSSSSRFIEPIIMLALRRRILRGVLYSRGRVYSCLVYCCRVHAACTIMLVSPGAL